MKIVVNPEVLKYFKKNREIRLDFVSVTTSCGLIIPIYYYTNPQIQSMSFNAMDICKTELISNINNKLIKEEIIKVKALGYTIVHMSLVDNLHTHPVGITDWSGTDKQYTLKPEWEGTMYNLGCNMLYSFKGEIYKATLREFNNKNYHYEDIETVELENYTPSFEGVDENHFEEIVYKPFIPKNNRTIQNWLDWFNYGI